MSNYIILEGSLIQYKKITATVEDIEDFIGYMVENHYVYCSAKKTKKKGVYKIKIAKKKKQIYKATNIYINRISKK